MTSYLPSFDEFPQRAKATFHSAMEKVRPVLTKTKTYTEENTDHLVYACVAIVLCYALYRMYSVYSKASNVDDVDTLVDSFPRHVKPSAAYQKFIASRWPQTRV